jgi:signal transduction histidine kinase
MSRRDSQSLPVLLTRMNLLVSGIALLIAAVAFFSYDLVSFRNELIRNLEAEAEIVGANSVSALTFNDPASAATTLQSLQRSTDILAAVLTDSDGTQFATYGVPSQDETESHRLAAGEANHAWSSGTHVVVAHRVVFQGKTVGTVTISANLTEIRPRARQYLLIACGILLICMAAAVAISYRSRRLIAEPVIALADTALRISRDRDYSVRATVDADSTEIAVLVDAFNTMLAQIGERDAALSRARDELEVRVDERTAELKAANRELEAFSYTVAHDLRGPLDAIHSIAFLLEQAYGSGNDPNIPAMLAQLTASTENMGSLIDDLLNFARASTAPLTPVPLDLTGIAQEIATQLQLSGPNRDVDFNIAATPQAQVDPGLIRIVLDNLLRNAWKYTSHHRKACIEFGARQSFGEGPHRGKIVYFVRDDGAGFDPGLAEKLFQPFYRLHSQSDFPGTGIGLATVQRILARQGGSIWAEAAPEKGATFYFTLG